MNVLLEVTLVIHKHPAPTYLVLTIVLVNLDTVVMGQAVKVNLVSKVNMHSLISASISLGGRNILGEQA